MAVPPGLKFDGDGSVLVPHMDFDPVSIAVVPS